MQQKNVISEINKLRSMTVGELRQEWARLYGEPARSSNRESLFRRLAYRIQELVQGGLSAAARARLDELGEGAWNVATSRRQRTHDAEPAGPHEPEPRVAPIRDLRRPAAGTVIVREHRGRQLRLLVLDDAFELDGVRYASLSEAARAATGSRWNGWLFWGLTQRRRRS